MSAKPTADGTSRMIEKSIVRSMPCAGAAAFVTASVTTSSTPAVMSMRFVRMSIVRRWATSAASMPSAKYGSIAASVLENVMLSPWPAIDQL